MVSKSFSNLRNLNSGMTLIELIVVVFIIAMFAIILISNFPEIQRQYALSSAAYTLAQDMRKTQDYGLSGIQVSDVSGNPIKVQGYGIYVNLDNVDPASHLARQYIIYADVNGNQKYDGDGTTFCKDESAGSSDCIVDLVDLSKNNSNLYIKDINNVILGSTSTSINFMPPDPIIKIDNLGLGNSEVGIELGLNSDNSSTKTVWVNTAGLIRVH